MGGHHVLNNSQYFYLIVRYSIVSVTIILYIWLLEKPFGLWQQEIKKVSPLVTRNQSKSNAAIQMLKLLSFFVLVLLLSIACLGWMEKMKYYFINVYFTSNR